MGIFGKRASAEVSTELAGMRAEADRLHLHFGEDGSDASRRAFKKAAERVEDLEAELRAAIERERKAAEKAAADAHAEEVAALKPLAEWLRAHPAFVEQEKRAIVALAQQLVRRYAGIVQHSDEYARRLRELDERSRRLGIPMPSIDTSTPSTAEQIVRLIQLEVQRQHVADGLVDYTTSQRAVALVEGRFG